MIRRRVAQATARALGTLLLLVPPGADAAAPLRDEQLAPYFGRGLAGRGRTLLEAGRAKEAAALLDRAQRRVPPREREQARFLLAVALQRGGDFVRAAELFAALDGSYPLLRDYHRYFGAIALYRTRRFDRAAEVAAGVSRESPLSTDAQLVRADALRALGRIDESAAIWRDYLARHPKGKRVGEAHFRVAEALQKGAAAAGPEARARLAEALGHYVQILVRSPLSSVAQEAEKQAQALALLVGQGARTVQLTPEQRYEQSLLYYQAMRNQAAEAGFAAVLKEGAALRPEVRCRAAYYQADSVFKQRQPDRAEPLFLATAQSCRAAGDLDLVVKALYKRARGLMRKKAYQAAADQFAAIEKEFPKHSYADDARMLAAEAYDELGQETKVTELLEALPRDYPQGDMVREALWRVARQAYLKQDYQAALRHLDHTIDKLGRAGVYYAEGQALYWKARILERLRRPKEAAPTYERCLREYPLTYYALLSFNRLREGHPALFKKLQKELLAPVGRRTGSWALPTGAFTRTPAFARGVELARLGLSDEAGREFAKAGLAMRGNGPLPEAWVAAALLDRAGLWHLSHQVPRSRDASYKRTPPLDENYRRWTIAYPRAFPALVEQAARTTRLPPGLILAVMREESGFVNVLESYANAIGLMQLILPTAKAAGSRHKLAVDRTALQDPAVNIKLGSTFLSWLMQTFSGCPPLAIAGYNAGQGAVFRWLKRFGSGALDELVERIPFDQTRRYTKRVLASFFAYTVLYGRGERLPRIPLRIPAYQHRSFERVGN
ncbi:MAG: transglycosylase SLT domain-containing protein [Deltaproteobacteria bacterium]|nr:transglycosylase SLT domain-containing protein [Deltaproteobacteria bacterium]